MTKNNRKKAEELNNQGNQFLKDNNFIQAKTLYEKAILADAEYPTPYYNLGILYKINNDINNAIKYLIKNIELDKDNVDAYINLGKIYDENGEYKKAYDNYNKALTLNSKLYGEKHPQTLRIYSIIEKMYYNKNLNGKDFRSYISNQIKTVKDMFRDNGFTIYNYYTDKFYDSLILTQGLDIIFCYIYKAISNIIALDYVRGIKNKPIWLIDGQNHPSIIAKAKDDIILYKVYTNTRANSKDGIKTLIVILNSNIANYEEVLPSWNKNKISVTRLSNVKPDDIPLLSEYIRENKAIKPPDYSVTGINKFIEYMNSKTEKEKDEMLFKYRVDNDIIKKKSREQDDSLRPKEIIDLDYFGTNLNEKAAKGHLQTCIGREKEIDTIYQVLYRGYKNNPLLIGHSGVGKTVIIEEIANRIVRGDVPDFLKQKRIIEVSGGELISGTTLRGQLELRIENLLNELKKNPDTILFIDELHTIINAGKSSNVDSASISQMLKPALSRNEVTVIGSTTYDDYRKYIQNDKAFERRFYPIKIDEMSLQETKEVITRLKPYIENHYQVIFKSSIIDLIIQLSDKYIKKRHFPDKAIDIIEKVASSSSIKGKTEITIKDIKTLFEEYVGIRYLDTDTESFRRLLNMEDYLSSQIFGQGEAIMKVANQIRLTKRKLDLKPERPDGVFLFTGPTGVGKTELAKSLCRFLYGNENKLLKLDMTEYSELGSIAKLLGSPPGYNGYLDYPFMTKFIEENPSSVLLLDEIEKAHEEVIKLFMQVMDEGRLRDSKGKTIYFSDVTVILTTNAFQRSKAGVGFGNKDRKEEEGLMNKELLNHFPIEFLNRIDEIILFNSLKKEHIKQIIEKKLLSQINERFKKENLMVEIDDKVMDLIIELGYEEKYGARNIERVFEKHIISEISNFLYKKDITDITPIILTLKKGKISIRIKNKKNPKDKPSHGAGQSPVC
jgi:ATP-dependent Clp protease ATP-binding subunit ClpC